LGGTHSSSRLNEHQQISRKTSSQLKKKINKYFFESQVYRVRIQAHTFELPIFGSSFGWLLVLLECHYAADFGQSIHDMLLDIRRRLTPLSSAWF